MDNKIKIHYLPPDVEVKDKNRMINYNQHQDKNPFIINIKLSNINY